LQLSSQPEKAAEKLKILLRISKLCHSERSEESLFDLSIEKNKQRRILRFAAQNGKEHFFSRL
jgi:hypothetical protein